jgi:glucokinase
MKRILAADIGGTNARFAEVRIQGLSNLVVGEPHVFPTWSDDIGSFDQLLAHFSRTRPAGMPALEEYDALSVALAGAVNERKATLPNISWDIDLTSSQPMEHLFLLNDFTAQAHGFLDPEVFERINLVRPGPGFGPGSIAVVGAGTGLGHAALKPYRGRRVVLGSEAGHCSFAFNGKAERKIEASMLARSGKGWLSGDDVVSGSGVAMIHKALSGESVSPAEALRDGVNNETCRYYARFYARACRNYCLAMHPVETLIISGGIAAKNPHIVESEDFIEEFDNGRSYRHLLERIPIYLNRDEAIGLRGAAIHAWLELTDPPRG